MIIYLQRLDMNSTGNNKVCSKANLKYGVEQQSILKFYGKNVFLSKNAPVGKLCAIRIPHRMQRLVGLS